MSNEYKLYRSLSSKSCLHELVMAMHQRCGRFDELSRRFDINDTFLMLISQLMEVSPVNYSMNAGNEGAGLSDAPQKLRSCTEFETFFELDIYVDGILNN